MQENIQNNDSNIDFLFTNDGSVGLYNYDVDDIYHSVFGAKSEAKDKFVTPLNFENNFFYKNELNILDICYGIGYNTKTFIEKILQSNYKGKVNIDLLETDKSLVLFSPFIKDGFFKNNPEISYIILRSLFDEIKAVDFALSDIIENKKVKKFFEPFYRRLIKRFKFYRYAYDHERCKQAFLHNIYYHCISSSMKIAHKCLKYKNFKITPHIGDARQSIKALSKLYDIVFLDAFTPAKQPLLWTLDFFSELYRITQKDCMILTYSNSASVRHAMKESGFFVGKLFDKQKRHCGTCASKNPEFIKNKLDEYDTGLMNTSAGVYYIDRSLNSSCEDILKEHKERKQKLNLESSSHFIKRYKNMRECRQYEKI